jgi:hypothetical protein
MINNQRGIIKFLFALILVFVGVIIWLFWQGRISNLNMKSVKFDNALSDLFLSSGIDDSLIISQHRVEKKSGITTWIEFNKEISVPNENKLKELKIGIETLVKKHGLELAETKPGSNSAVFEIKQKNRVLNRITFSLPLSSALPEKTGQQLKKRKRMALVIDDLGYKSDLSEFLSLGIPVNFAVMPGERATKDIVKQLNDKKIPFLMHLPMEPEKYPKIDPGKLALMLKMSDKEISDMYKKDLASVNGACGINNHMGSAFTANEEKMRVFLGLVKKSGLFFLDSETTSKSKAKKIADEIGLKNLRNDVFIDLKDEPDFMNKQFEEIKKKIEKYGQCIAIGHYQRKHMIPVIKENIKKFRASGIEFVYLKDLFNK